MQAVVFNNPGDIRLEDRRIPEPGQGEVRLRVVLAGICSTDLHIVQGHFTIRTPRVLGHEIVGAVDALGPGVAGHWLGQTCGVSPARFCGNCAPCRSGAPELCANFECLGNTQDGGFAEYTLVRCDQLVPLGELPAEAAVWLEPLACVLHAIQVIAPAAQTPILILGAGTFGKLMVQALRATSGAHLSIVDPNPEKVKQALALGAQAGWTIPRSGPAPDVDYALQHWAPDGLQAIIDTTGVPDAIQRAIQWAGPKARIHLFGVFDPAASVTLQPSLIFTKELTLSGTAGMTPASFRAAESLLRERRLDLEALVAAVIDLYAVPQVLEGRTRFPAGKVLVRPGRKGG